MKKTKECPRCSGKGTIDYVKPKRAKRKKWSEMTEEEKIRDKLSWDRRVNRKIYW